MNTEHTTERKQPSELDSARSEVMCYAHMSSGASTPSNSHEQQYIVYVTLDLPQGLRHWALTPSTGLNTCQAGLTHPAKLCEH